MWHKYVNGNHNVFINDENGTKIRKTIDDNATEFISDFADSVDFKISVNPGEMPVTMSKVASGGEMSRVMLALRSSINQKSGSDTVIFDEIDAGVSGSTSERIGLLLKKLSKGKIDNI